MQLKKNEEIREIQSAGAFWRNVSLCFLFGGGISVWGATIGATWPVHGGVGLGFGIFLFVFAMYLLLFPRKRAIWWWKALDGYWEAKEEFPTGAEGIILGFFPYRLLGRRVEVYYHGGSKWHGCFHNSSFMIEQGNGGERTADAERIAQLIPDKTARNLLRVSAAWRADFFFGDCWITPYSIRPISRGSQVLARWQGEQMVFSDPDELVQLLIHDWEYYTSRLQDWLGKQNRPGETLQNLPDLFAGLKREVISKTPACLLERLCAEVKQIASHLVGMEKGSSRDTLAADVCGLVAAWQDISARAAENSLSPDCVHPREVMSDLRQRLDMTASSLRAVLAEIRVDKRFANSQRGQELEASLVLALNDIIPIGDDKTRQEAGIHQETVWAARKILEDKRARAASAGTAPTAPAEPVASVVVSPG